MNINQLKASISVNIFDQLDGPVAPLSRTNVLLNGQNQSVQQPVDNPEAEDTFPAFTRAGLFPAFNQNQIPDSRDDITDFN